VKVDTIHLSDLVAFFKAPQRFFLRHRLGINLPDINQDFPGELPGSLGPLERNLAIRDLLGSRAGEQPSEFDDQERYEIDRSIAIREMAGVFPPPQLWDESGSARGYVAEVDRIVMPPLKEAICEYRSLEIRLMPGASSVILQADLPIFTFQETYAKNRLIHGTFRISPSKNAFRHHVQTAIEYLALVAAYGSTEGDDGFDWRCAVILENNDAEGKSRSKSATWSRPQEPVDAQRTAIQHLEKLIFWYLEGLRQPIPLFMDLVPSFAKNRPITQYGWNGLGKPGTLSEVQFCFGQISADEVQDLSIDGVAGAKSKWTTRDLAIQLEPALTFGSEGVEVVNYRGKR
jgi:hypothetical protein